LRPEIPAKTPCLIILIGSATTILKIKAPHENELSKFANAVTGIPEFGTAALGCNARSLPRAVPQRKVAHALLVRTQNAHRSRHLTAPPKRTQPRWPVAHRGWLSGADSINGYLCG